MQSKLTLRLDDALIRKAKGWAAARGISISEAVASFFAQLPEAEENTAEFSPWLQQLTGVGASAATPDRDQLDAGYLDYLEAKYR